MNGVGTLGGVQPQFHIDDTLSDSGSVDSTTPLLGTRSGRADSALGGREIGAGRGEQRSAVGEFFSGIKDAFTKFFGVGRHADSLVNHARANPQLATLTQPRAGSPLLEPAILNRLAAHGAQSGSKATPAQILAFAAAGERIAAALAQATPEQARSGTLMVDGVEVKSSVFTTRALTWHLMTQAACLDEERGIDSGHANSSMVTSGTMVMADPDNKLFNFLNAAPTSYGRVSTHFRERAVDGASHFLGKPVQRGIEDYQNLMPGQNASLLFDRIKPSADGVNAGKNTPDQLFIKLEHAGTPPFWRVTESHEGLSHSVRNAFSAIGRFIAHTFSFAQSRNAENNATEGVVRQEHVYKGRLKETVADPYIAALNQLHEAGVLDADSRDSMEKEVKKHGLPRIEARLTEFLGDQSRGIRGDDRIPDGVRDTLLGVRTAIQTSHDALGDDYGIERRGVEVHLSYLPIAVDRDAGFMHEIPLN